MLFLLVILIVIVGINGVLLAWTRYRVRWLRINMFVMTDILVSVFSCNPHLVRPPGLDIEGFEKIAAHSQRPS